MAKPFANAPHHFTNLDDSYIIGIQIGSTQEEGGLSEMKYITIKQLREFLQANIGSPFNYRGEYSSATPTDLAVNDYFYAMESFYERTPDTVMNPDKTYYVWDEDEEEYVETTDEEFLPDVIYFELFEQYHFYEWNGSSWSDISGYISGVLTQADIVDDLLSNDSTKVLSAKQGKVLDAAKANKNEMSVTPGTGADSDKTTIQLKTGTSATVLTQHQSLDAKADKVVGATVGDVPQLDSTGNLVDSNVPINTILTEDDVKNNTTSLDTDKPLSAYQGTRLQSQIDALKAMGRFLSLWDCITGLPVSFPLSTPYEYKSGDYFVISNSVSYIKDNTDEYDDTADYAVNEYTVYQDVLYKCNTAIVGGEAWNSAHWDAVTNDYIPTGSSYTGTASSVVATEEIFVNDSYVYDGTYWLHQINTGGKVAFQNIKGNPKDNLALAAELNDVVKHENDLPSSTLPINADQLNGHQDTYFGKAGNLAVVETSPSTAAHSVGELLVFNGTLYQVTSAIAIGDTLTVGSNIAGQTVANALSDIINTLNGLIIAEPITGVTNNIGEISLYSYTANKIPLALYDTQGYKKFEFYRYGNTWWARATLFTVSSYSIAPNETISGTLYSIKVVQ